MKKKDIIKSFKDGFDIPNGDIILHEFPKWSFYPSSLRVHQKGISSIHSFEFNAIEQRVIYKYFKTL